MLINHLSVSRGQCYEECQQKYKYRYHLKVIPDQPEQIYFVYGKLVHKAAELYVQEKGSRSIIEYGKDLLYGNIKFQDTEKLYLLNTSYKNKFWEHLKVIQLFTEKVGFDGELECEITYDLDPPNQKILTGFIDRLIIKNNKAIIIDYKTSKNNSWRKTKETIKKDLQLNTYAAYVSEKFNIEPENIQAALVYVEGGNVISTNFNKQYLEKTKNDLKNLFYQIENSDENKVIGNIGNHCNRCDFNNICPFFRKSS
jgi:CRISPR/Cas system-associated exonuclease Cas4 (RecB family)